jgi:hypothetical protein
MRLASLSVASQSVHARCRVESPCIFGRPPVVSQKPSVLSQCWDLVHVAGCLLEAQGIAIRRGWEREEDVMSALGLAD